MPGGGLAIVMDDADGPDDVGQDSFAEHWHPRRLLLQNNLQQNKAHLPPLQWFR